MINDSMFKRPITLFFSTMTFVISALGQSIVLATAQPSLTQQMVTNIKLHMSICSK